MAKKKISYLGAIGNNRKLYFLLILIITVSLFVSRIKKPNVTNQQVVPTPTSQFTCEVVSKSKIKLEKIDDQILLVDRYHNYQLNVTRLPEIAFNDGLGCANEYYEFDLYNLRTGDYEGSVARVSAHAPTERDTDVSLEEIARTKFYYTEGIHVDPRGNNYNQPYNSTPLVISQLANGTQLLSWEDIFTDQPRYHEGTTAVKNYLLFTKNKIYHFLVISWDIPSFNKAIRDFDEVIMTFQSPVN